MNKKKTTALVLALGMAVTGSLAVYGAEVPVLPGNAVTEAVSITTDAADSNVVSGSQPSTLTGTIKVTSISVKVPTAAAFEINPNASVEDPNVDRITAQSSEYTITNTSTVPIEVSITGVTTTADGGFVTDPALLDTTSKSVMFAVRKSGEAAPTSAAGDVNKWFSATADYSNTPYKVSATAEDNKLAAGASLEMKLYGATTTGWSNGNTFTVVPTFTISVS